MAQFKVVSPAEIDLLKKEMEALAEVVSKERLEREAELTRIQLEIEALKLTLADRIPAFMDTYKRNYVNLMHTDKEIIKQL